MLGKIRQGRGSQVVHSQGMLSVYARDGAGLEIQTAKKC